MPSYIYKSGSPTTVSSSTNVYAYTSPSTTSRVNYIKVYNGTTFVTVYQYDTTPPVVPKPSVVSGGTSDTVSWTAVTDADSGIASATLYQGIHNITTNTFTNNYQSVGIGTGGAGNTTMSIPNGIRNTPTGDVYKVYYWISATDNVGLTTDGDDNPATTGDFKYTKPLGAWLVAPDRTNLGNNAADSRNISNTAWRNETSSDEGVVGYSSTRAYGAWFYNNNAFSDVCRGWAPDSGSILLQRAGAAQPNRGNTGTFTIQGHTSPTKSGALTFVSTTITDSISGNDGVGNPALSAGMLSSLGNDTIKGFGLSSFSSSLGNVGFLRGLTTQTNAANPFGFYSGTVFLDFT